MFSSAQNDKVKWCGGDSSSSGKCSVTKSFTFAKKNVDTTTHTRIIILCLNIYLNTGQKMKVPLESISFAVMVLSCLTFVDGRGGSGSGGGSGGGGGGRGGGGIGGGRGTFGKTSSGSKGISRRTGAAVILGSGAAGYAAYRAHQNSRNRDRERGDKENPDFDSFEHYGGYEQEGRFDYKTQESTSYYASEGIGMSAWALIFLILAIIAIGTVGWYCCNVFLPVWQDNQQMRRRSVLGRMNKDEVPLQETPSTATPSP